MLEIWGKSETDFLPPRVLLEFHLCTHFDLRLGHFQNTFLCSLCNSSDLHFYLALACLLMGAIRVLRETFFRQRVFFRETDYFSSTPLVRNLLCTILHPVYNAIPSCGFENGSDPIRNLSIGSQRVLTQPFSPVSSNFGVQIISISQFFLVLVLSLLKKPSFFIVIQPGCSSSGVELFSSYNSCLEFYIDYNYKSG